MVFFRKNKRQSRFCTKRTAFCALFLSAILGLSALTSLILNANAQDAPVKSVEITSTQTSYSDNQQGAWKVTKSAEWTDIGKARITFDVKSRAKYDTSEQYDIVMVIDNSASMDGNKLLQVKTDAARLINSLISDNRNRIAIVSFSTDATIRTGFTNDQTELINQINNIPLGGQTNYYKGLLKAEEVLDGYVEQDGRNLILLFLTDGCPNEDVTNGVAQYEVLKAKYPGINISGIQYEMGETILQPIIDISDHQFIADMETLNNVLFNATITPYAFDDFIITDYLNQQYWSIANVDAISATMGTTTLTDENGTPKITWDLSGVYHAGQIATMTIDINLNSEYLTMQDILLPTNTHETIVTSIIDTPSENVDSPLTPILADRYSVIYDGNQPSDCTVIGEIPATQKYTLGTVVEKSDNQLTCAGYEFKGWSSTVSGDNYINDDYFRMPGEDVTIRAIWAKPSISKSLDGTIKTGVIAILDYGEPVSAKLKVLAGQENADYTTVNTNITAIKRSRSIPSSVDLNNPKYNIAHQISPLPVYVWFDNGTIYYYSDASIIYYYGDTRGMFYSMTSLSDISGLSDISAEYLYDPEYMFFNTPSLTDFSVFSTWYTPRLRSLYYMFSFSGIDDVEPLRNWDTSGVRDMSYMFYGASNITNIDALEDWDTSSVQYMEYMFHSATSLIDINGAEDWNVGEVLDMSYMFYNANSLQDIDGAINWRPGKCLNMQNMFDYASSLTNIDGAANWTTGNVTNMAYMFHNAINLTNIDGALNWTTSNVTNMAYMFYNNYNLTNVDGAEKWDVRKVTTMAYMFTSTGKLNNIDKLTGWRMPALLDMNSMFSYSGLENVDGAINWDVSNVTNMTTLFLGNSSLTNIDGLENWDVSSAQNMSTMFTYDTGLTSLSKLHKWRPSSATTMTWMFAGCTNIESLDGLQNWTVGNVQDFSSMFYQLGKITSVSKLAGWRPTSATTMTWMFGLDNQITDLIELEYWNVSSEVNIESIFETIPNTVTRPSWANGE